MDGEGTPCGSLPCEPRCVLLGPPTATSRPCLDSAGCVRHAKVGIRKHPRYRRLMHFDIRDLSTIKGTLANLGKLIEACRPRGPFYAHGKEIANEVIRGAKGLRSSLEKLQHAVEDPSRTLSGPTPSTKSPIIQRLCQEPRLHELARFISYGGKRPDQVEEFMAGQRASHGDKAMWAMHELTATGPESGLTVLRPEALRACRVLLGPAPDSDEYAAYWQKQGCAPPEGHLTPPPAQEQPGQEAPRKPRARSRGRAR